MEALVKPPRCSECPHLADKTKNGIKHYCHGVQDWRHPNQRIDCKFRNIQFGFVANNSITFHKRHGMNDALRSEKLSKKLMRRVGFNAVGTLAHWCPACQRMHDFAIVKPFYNGSRWEWNQDVDKPTMSPSMKVEWSRSSGIDRCHYFLEDGKLRYLADSTHDWKGQIVDLPDIPIEIWKEAGIE